MATHNLSKLQTFEPPENTKIIFQTKKDQSHTPPYGHKVLQKSRVSILHHRDTSHTNGFRKVSNPLTVQNTLLKKPAPFTMCIIFIHNIIVVHSEEKIFSHPKR